MRPIKYFMRHPYHIFFSIIKKYGKFIPDKLYLRIRFYCETGKRLDFSNPKTFQEKIQWLKIYNKKPEYTLLVDKLGVKSYISSKIGEEYVIPTLGQWESPREIDFDSLPNQFVLKTTHGGGSNGVIVCTDKGELNLEVVRAKLEKAMRADIYSAFREWPYKNVPRKIIAEQFISDGINKDLSDYKWYCFNGKPMYCQVIRNRNTEETIDFYDVNWQRQEFIGLNPNVSNGMQPVPCPENLSKMIEIAEQLSDGHPFLRVDLYNIAGKIYFGELTFYPASGMGSFRPQKWNSIMGDYLTLPDV